MLTPARPFRALAALPLAAALFSAAPAVRWCELPWSAVTVECFAACETAPAECPPRCGEACSPRPCERGEPDRRVPAHERAFCVEAPLAATQGPAAAGLDPPAAPAELLAAAEVPEPACVATRPPAFEPPRPGSRPPGPAPPVRGPPLVA